MNKQVLFSQENVRKAFEMFDKDGSGKISVDEIKAIIGEDLAEDQVWLDILKTADSNNTGEIDIYEFAKLMQSI